MRKAIALFSVAIGNLGCGDILDRSESRVNTVQVHDYFWVDASGKRQGFWQIVAEAGKDTAYAPGSIIEQGKYIDNKKDGRWITFDSNGDPSDTIIYDMDKPRAR